MERVLRTARAAAGIVLHPSRWPDARKHLARAWRGSTQRATFARLVRTDAAPRRPLVAVVLFDKERAARFEPEWVQRRWEPGAEVSDADVFVAQWPWSDPDEFRRFTATASSVGKPLVTWDTGLKGAPAAPEVAARAVVVAHAGRSEDYGDVPVAPGLVQPRWFNPVRASGKVGSSLTLDVTAEYGPRSRRYETITLTGSPKTLPDVLPAAAASGAVVLAEPQIPGAGELSVGFADEHVARAVTRHAELQRRYAQQTVRAALRSYSTTAASSTLLQAAGVPDSWGDRSVSAVVPTMRPGQISHVMEFVARQTDVRVQLVLVTHGFDAETEAKRLASEHGVEDLVVVRADASLTLGALMNLGVESADGRFISKMDDDNFYGRHYLGDLVATFDFTDAQVVGKWAHYTYLQASGATFLRFPSAENRYVDLVQGGTLTMSRELAVDLRFEDLPRRVDTTFLEKVKAAGGRAYSADRYNFVSVRAATTTGHTWQITDAELLAKPSQQLFFAKPWDHVEI